jgi:hypothetical protein
MHRLIKFAFTATVLVFLPIAIHGYAVKGILDLRLESFQSPIPIEGQWELYWNQLLMPKDQFGGNQLIEFPGKWKGMIVGEDTLTSKGFATYRLKVLLPEKVEDYELYIDDMYCSYALYVDGEIVAKNGKVGTSIQTSIPEWKPLLVDLNARSGILEIVLQISNWRHSKGGANNPILISKKGVLTRSQLFASRLQTTLFIFFLLTSFYFFYRFAFWSFELASFYFALFLVTYSYRLVGADLYLLHHWIQGYPWLLGIKLEYLSLYLSTLFFALYVSHMFKEETSWKLVKPLVFSSIVFSILVLFFPVTVFSQSLLFFYVVITVYIGYGFYVFTTASINERRGSLYGVISVAVVFAVFIYQMFYYLGWLEYVYIVTFIAHFIFLTMQSLQLYMLSEYNRKNVIHLKND